MLKYQDLLNLIVAEENKNKKNIEIAELEKLILRCPLLDFAKKTEILNGFNGKDPKELQRIAQCFADSEKDLFRDLVKAGLNPDDFGHKISNFINTKLRKVEQLGQADELDAIEKQIEKL